jgi:ribonucleoside-triphosphate reductase
MEVADESLNLRRNLIEDLTEKGLYPYSKFYLRDVRKKSGKFWSNHFNTIGLIGMNEACLNFMGQSIATKEGLEFSKEVLDFMNSKLVEFQKDGEELYNLEASPAEGSSYAIAKKDKELYPDIIVANEEEFKKGAEPFYTNSTHLPVNYTDDIFEALDLQDDLQTKYTGGTVFHGFIGELKADWKSVRDLVKKISENYKLPYFTITPTFSICPSHGYLAGEYKKCPKCEKECEVYSRVVGKIAPLSRWNEGKKSEFEKRETYIVTN